MFSDKPWKAPLALLLLSGGGTRSLPMYEALVPIVTGLFLSISPTMACAGSSRA